MTQTEQNEEPPSTGTRESNSGRNGERGSYNGTNGHTNGPHKQKDEPNVVSRVLELIKGRQQDTTLREALEEFIETAEQTDNELDSTSVHERLLIGNILKLRDMQAVDVMIPRADIVALDIETPHAEVLQLLSEKQHSRFVVFRDSLDDIAGTIHIKDILAALASEQKIVVADMVRDVPIVAPSMKVLDLMLLMRERRKHLVLVVDEFGGIDGLITIGDVIESIVGEIDDEYDEPDAKQIQPNKDGTVTADARLPILTFEEEFGSLLTEEERDDVDTIGGLMFFLAGRVPARGEILQHSSGVVFEVLEADPRRVSRVLIRNLPL